MLCVAALRGKACYCITYFSLEAAKECSRKKRPMDAPPKNLPTMRPGDFEFYRVWGLGTNKFFVSGRPLAPLANFANGGPHSLLATITLPLFSGSYLSYNERVIGLTTPCMSFHARSRKL